ncbi:MAG: hypothetical protein AB7P20_07010 [Rhizobiaceae bacterium]
MPTVFRFLTIIAAIVAAAYAVMFLLVMFVEPRQAEMSVNVPLDHIKMAPETTGTTNQGNAAAEPPVAGSRQ